MTRRLTSSLSRPCSAPSAGVCRRREGCPGGAVARVSGATVWTVPASRTPFSTTICTSTSEWSTDADPYERIGGGTPRDCPCGRLPDGQPGHPLGTMLAT
jgi:hypothetical protein